MLLNMPQLCWDLESLISEPLAGDELFDIPPKLKQKNYSIALVRYWFIYHFLLAENINRDYLTICEVGNNRRQIDFIQTAEQKGFPAVCIAKWDILSGNSQTAYGLDTLHELKTENRYDVIIFSAPSHIEVCSEKHLKSILQLLRPNGLLIGVSGGLRQQTKHIRRLAKRSKLSVDFLSGAYFLRNNGLISLQRKSWFRFNLFLGAVLPAFAGEIYWVLRK